MSRAAAVITPSLRHSCSACAVTSAAIGARSPSYGTAPIDSSSAISCWPVTVPAQNSWFFKTWLARRRTVHGGQLRDDVHLRVVEPGDHPVQLVLGVRQQRQMVHRALPDRLGQAIGARRPDGGPQLRREPR